MADDPCLRFCRSAGCSEVLLVTPYHVEVSFGQHTILFLTTQKLSDGCLHVSCASIISYERDWVALSRSLREIYSDFGVLTLRAFFLGRRFLVSRSSISLASTIRKASSLTLHCLVHLCRRP